MDRYIEEPSHENFQTRHRLTSRLSPGASFISVPTHTNDLTLFFAWTTKEFLQQRTMEDSDDALAEECEAYNCTTETLPLSHCPGCASTYCRYVVCCNIASISLTIQCTDLVSQAAAGIGSLLTNAQIRIEAAHCTTKSISK